MLDYGGDSVQVCMRVTRMLEDLMRSLPEDRHDVLRRYLNEVRGLPGAGRSFLERDLVLTDGAMPSDGS